jgi:hypothetical protein
MFHAGDSECVFGWLLEEDAVVATAKTETTLRRFELFTSPLRVLRQRPIQ